MPIGAQVPSERLPSPKIRLRGSSALTNDLLGASIQRAITRSIRSPVASVGGLQRVAISAALNFISLSSYVFSLPCCRLPRVEHPREGGRMRPPMHIKLRHFG